MSNVSAKLQIQELYREINSCREDILAGNGATCKNCQDTLDLIETLKDEILESDKRDREVVD